MTKNLFSTELVTKRNLSDALKNASSSLNNLTATSNPGINDDSGDGYSVGSLWQNTGNGRLYIMITSTIGAANWQWINNTSGLTIEREVPAGTQDGENEEFTISNIPFGETLLVFLNGVLQEEGNDYTFSGVKITFVTAPSSSDDIEVTYSH